MTTPWKPHSPLSRVPTPYSAPHCALEEDGLDTRPI
jgi:hypothetical protein